MAKYSYIYYSAAAATAVAGILHLILAPGMLNFNPNATILFGIGGAAQIFWALPMARRWGKAWYATGIAGTATLFLIWLVTRFPGNPITGRGGGVNEMAAAVESLQLIFIGLASALLVIESRSKKVEGRVQNK
ncbi:MAG TPA: hypothetical protein VJL54_04605 [Nitrososphaera sp.]|jgi:hypothetical protein|nr:hypothetical protein [Nitrososphaera sp.]